MKKGRRRLQRDTKGAEVIYHVSDSHGQNDSWALGLLDHYEDNHAPLPLTVVQTGDIFELSTAQAQDENAIRDKINEVLGNPSIMELIDAGTLLWQWDDWDFAGDNSSATHTTSRGIVEIDRMLPLNVRNVCMPYPQINLAVNGDARWSHTTKNSMIIAPDSRSRKDPVSTTSALGYCQNQLDGTGMPACWGEQLDWILGQLQIAKKANVQHIFFVSTQSFVDNLGVPSFPCDGALMGVRDSLGIFYKWERNEVLKMVKTLGLEDRFIVWSGDDHTPLVRRRDFWHAPYHVQDEEPVRDEALDVFPVYEFKAGQGGNTTRLFDSAEHPPLWWGGLDDYTNPAPAWGTAMSRHRDIGFCWRLQPGRPLEVSAVLLEAESTSYVPGQLPRPAGYEFWRRGLK